ncbi:hypothetical protein H4J58_18600 [Colwellia sp. MB3u-70]|uniref:hypothetical protein n=1 Tax=unclassified Colwellia TaxID=196834 RepID=UPI0015F4DD3A|nr:MULTISPECIES: hypothetical protein [unclassified Colwellia]MBA6292135.1 hypothetical protein [Colwellia sp. MB3u-8]MBA6309117.1 hypothetical protein [Colwellia sp. MB3u-70]
MSDRGWLALAAVGIEAEIKQHAIDGTITEQAYGQKTKLFGQFLVRVLMSSYLI